MKNRIEALDALRGLVMILMCLDHARDFFHIGAFASDPMNPEDTYPILYLTRIITHVCAPAFAWLAGLSIFFQLQQKSLSEVKRKLVKRGIWLILLELTVIQLAWHFSIKPGFVPGLVIWALGWAMLGMALILHLQRPVLWLICLTILFAHPLLDLIPVPLHQQGIRAFLLFFHSSGSADLGFIQLRILYPLFPLAGLMLLGYLMGSVFKEGSVLPKALWLRLGLASIAMFLFLRYLNVYGDPHPWQVWPNLNQTVYDFFRVTKYPFSVDYLLLTMGSIWIALHYFMRITFSPKSTLLVFGRQSLFFYIVHLYLLHALAMLAFLVFRFPILWEWWHDRDINLMAHHGYPLYGVYIAWALSLVVLYYFCRKYSTFKERHFNFITRWI